MSSYSSSQSPSPEPSSSRKRWASFSNESDQEDSTEIKSKSTKIKRKRASKVTVAEELDLEGEGSGNCSDKDSRKVARMIRNRSKKELLSFTALISSNLFFPFLFTLDAAQASRDRKKQHTDFLERRVNELESQLASTSSPANFSIGSIAKGSRSTKSLDKDTILSEENYQLKSQLEIERKESSLLRRRLDSLETTFMRLENKIISPDSLVPSLPITFSSLSTPTTTTSFQPIFSFISTTSPSSSSSDSEALDEQPIISYEDDISSPSSSSNLDLDLMMIDSSSSSSQLLTVELESSRIPTTDSTMQREPTSLLLIHFLMISYQHLLSNLLPSFPFLMIIFHQLPHLSLLPSKMIHLTSVSVTQLVLLVVLVLLQMNQSISQLSSQSGSPDLMMKKLRMKKKRRIFQCLSSISI